METPVLGIYQVRNGKLARAQMFYFDPEGVNAFLTGANSQSASASPPILEGATAAPPTRPM